MRSVETFFNKWTLEMAYVLGFFSADGSMYKNSNNSGYIGFYSSDKDLIAMLKQLMAVTNKIEVYHRGKNWKTAYVLQIGSKLLYNKFLKLGFTSNKSLSLKFPRIPITVLAHFVRGYFDGYGCGYFKISARTSRKGYQKHLHINFRCGNKFFLEVLQTKLAKFAKVGLGSLYFHTGAYSLAYSGKDVIKLYRFLYPTLSVPHLKRKRAKLEEGIKICGIEV